MSSIAPYNFMTNLPIFQARLIFHPLVKRSIFRCFSRKGGDKDIPVRYIPKKHRDVNENHSCFTLDNVLHTNSLSNNKVKHKVLDRIRRPQGSKIDHEQSNLSFDNVHGVSKNPNKQPKKTVKTKCVKPLQEIVQHVIVPQEVVQELPISKRDGQSQSQPCTLNQAVNDHNGVVDHEYMETLASDVKEIQRYNDVISEAKQKKLENFRNEEGAKQIAIQLLAKRALTEVELQKKLIAKKFPIIVVEVVVHDFKNRGLINDRLYAEVYSASRWKSSSWGPRRIKQELMKKGISEDNIEKAIKFVFEDKNCDESSGITLSSSSLQQLYMQASKQWQRCRNVAHETRKARVIRWLQYRGFNWGVISSILKKLETECP